MLEFRHNIGAYQRLFVETMEGDTIAASIE